MAKNKFSDWLLNLLEVEAAPKIDQSLPVLQELLARGYQIVKWQSGSSICATCRELNNQQWNLADFIAQLKHEAPLFEKSHPGDMNCHILVTGEGLPDVSVKPSGEVTVL